MARNSEIRRYLLAFAAKRGISVEEHVSDEPWEKISFFCILKGGGKTSTAVSNEHHDNALVMAFLSFCNPEMDFLPEQL